MLPRPRCPLAGEGRRDTHRWILYDLSWRTRCCRRKVHLLQWLRYAENVVVVVIVAVVIVVVVLKSFFFFHVYLVCLVCLTGTPKRIIPGRYVESWRELASKPFVHVWCAVPEIKVAQVEMVIICADMRHVVSSR